MSNYHGYKCRECGKELGDLRNENRHEEQRWDDYVYESWDAVYSCPDGCGELWLTIEETVFIDYSDDSVTSSQEIVASEWKVKVDA